LLCLGLEVFEKRRHSPSLVVAPFAAMLLVILLQNRLAQRKCKTKTKYTLGKKKNNNFLRKSEKV
jgi:hypothetical protein